MKGLFPQAGMDLQSSVVHCRASLSLSFCDIFLVFVNPPYLCLVDALSKASCLIALVGYFDGWPHSLTID